MCFIPILSLLKLTCKILWHLFCLLRACEILLYVPFSRRTMTGLRGRPIWTSWSSARLSVRCCPWIRAIPSINTGWAWPASWRRWFSQLYCNLMRPQLGKCVQLWEPQHRYDVGWLEWIQSRMMKMIKLLEHFYEYRLTELRLVSLEKRRLCRDFIVVSVSAGHLLETDFSQGYVGIGQG